MKITMKNKKLMAKLYEEPKKEELIITIKENPKDRYIVLFTQENDQGIQEGDLILCNKHDVLEKEIDGEKFYIIHIERVIGVINE